jgi:hypothetical protein
MQSSFEQLLFEKFEDYREKGLKKRRFKHNELIPLILNHKKSDLFDISKIGESIEKREIFQIKCGKGVNKVLLWSQMHGNEPTATQAIMDILNFLEQSDQLDAFRNSILENLTLYFIPMLNPDGAEVFKRENAVDIDINRDAIRLETPEAKILKTVRDEIQPQFGFNLHDQALYYSVGLTKKPATMAFLAPSFNYEKEVDQLRENSMKLIVHLNKILQNFIPGQVARYNDDYEPRAFGDKIQKWGTSSILIESGGYFNDPEKQFVRKLNFVTILSALNVIVTKSYLSEDLFEYLKIPQNKKEYLFDLIIRDVLITKGRKSFKADIAINRMEIESAEKKDFYYTGTIMDIGDLSVFSAYNEFNAEGLTIVEGKTFPKIFNGKSDINKATALELLKQGFTSVMVKNFPGMEFTHEFPIEIVQSDQKSNTSIGINKNANFLLQKNKVNLFAVINGFVYDLKNN